MDPANKPHLNGRKCTVTLHLRNAAPVEAGGWTCGWEGLPLVVHRTPWSLKSWQVTDPQTGFLVLNGASSRNDALNRLAMLCRRVAGGDPVAFAARFAEARGRAEVSP